LKTRHVGGEVKLAICWKIRVYDVTNNEEKMMSNSELNGSEGYLGDKLIWRNPPGLGHFAIKLRKQLLEEEIIKRCRQRKAAQEQEVGENTIVADNQQGRI
jgi:hypothetical protein